MTTALLPQFATFGEALRYLRRRARLTQGELSIAVGYSVSQISRLEQNERQIDAATLLALFVPALGIEDQPEWIDTLLAFMSAARSPKVEELLEVAPQRSPLAPRIDPAPATNLPARLTSFVGRQEAISALRQLVAAKRLVTLTGAGGVGKSSMAQVAGSQLIASFSDGVWWVELAPLATADLVPQAITTLFKLPEISDRTHLEALTTYLQEKQLLLMLDNCEHLVDECADVVNLLLRACPHLHILTTSREALRVESEIEWPVAPLTVPLLAAGSSPPGMAERLLGYEAVTLFIERARSIQPAFAWSDQIAPSVASVCTQLDGIPLAIELAAARLKSMTVSELAARLHDRFNLLTGGIRTSLPRHQTLRAMLDWSYDLLPEAERALLRRLSVFSGGWTMDAAEAIAGAQSTETDPLQSPIELLLQLVNKSLVVVTMHETQTRYHLLETIRHYTAEKLQEKCEADATSGRHFDYFLALALQSSNLTLPGRQLTALMDRVAADLDNMRSALAWSRQQADGGEQFLRLASALWRFWTLRGGFLEGVTWLEEALAHGATTPLPMRATALYALADLMLRISPERCAALAQEALALCQQVGDRLGVAFSYSVLGDALSEQQDYGRALAFYRQALDGFRAINFSEYTAVSLRDIAGTLMLLGRPDEALPVCEECLARDKEGNFLIEPGLAYLAMTTIFQIDQKRGRLLFEQEWARQRTLPDSLSLACLLSLYGQQLMVTGDALDLDTSIQVLTESLQLWRTLNMKWWIGGSISRSSLHLGNAYTRRGDFVLAIECEREASRIYQEVGDAHGVAWAQVSIGWPALAQGDLPLAKTSFLTSLKFSRDGSMDSVPYALIGLAETYRRQEEETRAGRLFGASTRFDLHSNNSSLPLQCLTSLQDARAYLAHPTFARAWAEGEAMTVLEVIAYALG